MLTLFRASTLEDWTDIMYISIFGCDQYSSIYLSPESWTPDNKNEWCQMPEKNQILSPFFWVSFIIVSALVMLSLFIGAVTMSMTESMEQMKEEQEEATRLRMKEKQMLKMQAQKEEVRIGGRRRQNIIIPPPLTNSVVLVSKEFYPKRRGNEKSKRECGQGNQGGGNEIGGRGEERS
jgi:hypothetical protein